MLSPSISNNFPVMNASEKRSVGGDGSKIVVSFVEECVSKIKGKDDFFGRCIRIPCEIVVIVFLEELLDLVVNSVKVSLLNSKLSLGVSIICSHPEFFDSKIVWKRSGV
jgi:hypothetical protein